MSQYIMRGGVPLTGEVTVSGAKNAALGILAAAVMTDEDVCIDNLPDVRDINMMLDAIREIGAKVERTSSHSVTINASSIHELCVESEYMSRIRASYYLIGALLGKYKSADVPLPGGCAIGQVSGTGTNTCCSLPENRIGKLGRSGERRMIVNLESGMYDGMPRGDFDRELDEASHNPGIKHFEKITAGVYLGELCHRMLQHAAAEGLLSPESCEKVKALGWIDSAVIDAWAMGEKLEDISVGEEDAAFVQTLCAAMFERSARCMCTNLAAIALLSGEKNVSICAEGSLVQKGRVYHPLLEELVHQVIRDQMDRNVRFTVGYETTLAGSAAAALLNL